MLSDDDVIASVKEGKTQNFEILVERYKKRIVNFINRMISDYDEAENISQDVFLKVYEKISQYKSQSNFSSFIFTIAKNLTLNYIRKQKAMLFFSSFFSSHQEEKYFSSTHNPQMEAEDREKDLLLVKALGKLNESQRLALILKVYLEQSYVQIQEITGWSIPKIETLISRAKQNLKKFLQENVNLNV